MVKWKEEWEEWVCLRRISSEAIGFDFADVRRSAHRSRG